MAVINNLKNQHIQRIFFARIKYRSEGIDKELFVSDNFISIPKNLVSGDKIDPEIILGDIPYFIRELDLVDQDVVVKSAYTISLQNQNEAFTTFFMNNHFNGFLIELYVTTENDIDPFDCIKIMAGSISDVSIGDKISLKISEVSDLTKMQLQQMEKFDYTYQAATTSNTNKPILYGKINGYVPTSITNFSETTDFATGIMGTLRTFQSILGTDLEDSDTFYRNNQGYYRTKYLVWDGEWDFRFNAGTTFIAGAQYVLPSDRYVSFTISTSRVDQAYVNSFINKDTILLINNTEYQFVAIKPGASNSYILKQKSGEDPAITVQSEDFELFYRSNKLIQNTKYLISTNKTKTKVQSDIISITNISTNCFIELADNWNWIENTELVYLTSTSNADYCEEFIVNGYDPVTKKIYIALDQWSGRYPLHTLKCNYDYVQSIRIDDKTFSRKRTFYTYNPRAGSEMGIGVESAKLGTPDLKLVYNTPGITGNKHQFIIQNDPSIGSPYTPIVTTSSTVTTVKIRETLTTTAQVVTALNASAAPFTTYSKGSSSGFPAAMNGFFMNGIVYAPFINLNAGREVVEDDITGSRISSNSLLYSVAFANSASPTVIDSRLKYIVRRNIVTFDGTETASQMADKVVTAINTGVMSDYLTAVKIPLFNYVKIKWHKCSNYNFIGANYLAKTFDSDHSIWTYLGARPFIAKLEKTNDLVVELDTYGLSILANIAQLEPEYYCKFSGPDNSTTPSRTESFMLVPTNPSNTTTIMFSTSIGDLPGINTPLVKPNAKAGNIVLLRNAMIQDTVTEMPVFFPNNHVAHIMSIDDQNGNVMYISSPILSTSLNSNEETNRFRFTVLEMVEAKTIAVNYRDEFTHLGYFLTEMLDNVYGITAYNTASIDFLKDEFNYLSQNMIFTTQTEFYKVLNEDLKAFNLSMFINKDGLVDIKFFDTINVTEDFNIQYTDVFSRDFKSDELKYTDIIYNHNYVIDKKSYTSKLIENIVSAKVPSTFKNTLTINSSNMMALADDPNAEYLGESIYEYVVEKYKSKDVYLSLVVGMDQLDQIELFKNFKLIGDPLAIDDVIFKICKIEMNFDKIKITAKRIYPV